MRRWSLPSKLERLLLKDDREGVLFLLSRITALNSKDFREHDKEYLRFAGQFRIQLLIDWFMYREALAWVCLECEIYPDNLHAQILKESLKSHILNLPSGEEKTEKPEKTWNNIAGMYELKSIIESDIIRPLKERKLYEKFNVSIPNGFLFYGPPGCGKTFFARKIAERLSFDFIEIKTSDIASIYVHGTQKEISRVFDDARKRVPAVLFFDEMEAMVPGRNRTDVSFPFKSESDEFLAQLNADQNKGLIIIGATNYLRSIDEAILRPGRFDKKIFVGPPDMVARGEAFKIFLKNFPQKNIRYDFIAEMSDYFTYSDIQFICEDLKRKAIEKKLLVIDTDFVGKFVSKYKPTLNDEKLQEYF